MLEIIVDIVEDVLETVVMERSKAVGTVALGLEIVDVDIQMAIFVVIIQQAVID